MDLAVVIPRLDGYGGSEIYLLECLKRWQTEAQVTVYTPSFRKALFSEFDIGNNVRVVKLPAARTRDHRFKLFNEIVVMPRIWEQHLAPHDLYFNYLFPTQMIQRRPSVWFAAEPCRMIFDLRQYAGIDDEEIEVHFYPNLEYDRISPSDLEVLLQVIEKIDGGATFDRLAVNSLATGRYVENIYGRKADAVAYPGITLPEASDPPREFDKVIHIGRLWKHKRIDLAVEAMAKTRSPNQLILVGEGPEEQNLRRLSDRLGLADQVVFAGNVSMAERDRLIRESTCCVYTPVREPFGMVPLEAAAAGRAVVATLGGGYSEILDRESAVFVPADSGLIAQGIHKLMSNPSLAMEMGRHGREVVTPYTWDRTAATLMDLFRDTVEAPGRRGSGVRGGRRRRNRTELGAHYYPWYLAGKNPRHWNENSEHAGITDFPRGGPYTSTHRSVLKRHLGQAMRAGLDFLVINWQVDHRGVKPADLDATRKLFELAAERDSPVKLAIMLSFDAEDPEVFLSTIRRVKEEFVPSEIYHHKGAGPMLWFYFNDPFQGFFYHHYRELRAMCAGVNAVATGAARYHKFMPRIMTDFFKGWCFYSPLEVATGKTREILWRDNYRDFSEEPGNLKIFTISPGFDDRHLTSRFRQTKKVRCVPRRGTRVYEKMQDFARALHPAPDFVVITSFNEFHENTHIEPSKQYGDAFLRSTRAFKDRLLE